MGGFSTPVSEGGSQDTLQAALGGGPNTPDSPSKAVVRRSPRPKSGLTPEEEHKILRQLEEWLEVERIRQAPNRYQMAIDHDFYDGLQWSDEDAQELAIRGQAPLVYNKVAVTVQWITGTERRTRIDYKVYPRKEAAVNDAENKTKLMKYVQDVNKSTYARSRAFDDTAKVGVGWLETGVRGDPQMEPVYDRYESWRNMIYDSQGNELDGSDWRYVFRQRWVDLDFAQALFPDKQNSLKSASVYSDYTDAQDNDEWYLGQILQERSADGSVLNRRTFIDTSTSLFNRRARVKLYEGWFRRPENKSYLHHPDSDLHNKEYVPNDPTHIEAVTNGGASTYDRLALQMWCSIFIKGGTTGEWGGGVMLQLMKSPYKHNDFPFTPIWANRRGRDNAPYGVIRNIRDPQEDFNKRMSKALFAISTRRIIMEEGAHDDIEELRLEAARPDGIIVKNGAKLLELHTDTDIAEEHVKFAEMDSKVIQDASGITDEQMGRKTNATSGVAIEARQDQGSTVTTHLYDNLRLAVELHGQKMLSLIGQYYTDEKTIRIIGSNKGCDYLTLNKRGKDEYGQPIVENDITATEADFVVDETDFRVTARQAMFETLTAMVSKMPPQISMMLLDDVLEFSDVPGTEQMIQTIRQITGKPDPNKKMTPQEEQAAQQKAQEQAQQQAELQQLQTQELAGKVALLQGKAAEANAKAQSLMAEIQNGQGDASAHAADLASLQKDTDAIVYELRKQILDLEGRIHEADVRALDRSRDANVKMASATLAARTSLEIADMNNATKEKIASAQDRTLEATQGLKAMVQGLNEQLQQLSAIKLDKPGAKPAPESDPFGKVHARLDKMEGDQAKRDDKAKQDKLKQSAQEKIESARQQADEKVKGVQESVAEDKEKQKAKAASDKVASTLKEHGTAITGLKKRVAKVTKPKA